MLAIRKRHEVRAQATTWGDWPGDNTGSSWAGAAVDTRSSLQLLTVYGCVSLIADSIATLPLDVYRESGGQRVEIATPMWLEEPTVDLDRTAWLTQILTSLLLNGNAFLWVRRDADRITQIVPLDPTQVQVRRDRGVKLYVVAGQAMTSFDILHIPAVMFPGADVGLSPVEAAKQSIGLGMSAQEYGARFFGQGATLSGVIETPGELTPDKAKEIAKAWAKQHSGKAKAHLPGVLEGGAVWKQTGVNNEQAQFLATRQYTAAEIAGQMFKVDPSDLGIPVVGTSLTYANLQDRNLRRAQVTLMPWMIRLEHAFSALLAKPRYVKFNLDGMLRADLKTRYEAHQIGITAGFLLRSEARELEDLPPLDGVDATVEAARKRRAVEDPLLLADLL